LPEGQVEDRRTIRQREIIEVLLEVAMTIQLNPETEKLVKEELQSGYFHSIDEIIVLGIRARHQKELPQRSEAERQQAVDRALDFARHKAVPLEGISIKELLHEGHRV
jgi:Arc/MetJ-type ribon-helix-helix transcriptional regulator